MSTITKEVNSLSGEKKILNPFVTYDSQKMHSHNTMYSTLWKVVALITAAGFIALATFAILYTTIQFPMHLPIVSILVLVGGLPTSFKAFKYLWDKQKTYAQEAAIDKKLIEYMKQPSNFSIPSSELEEKQLSSIFARYQYFKDEADQFKKSYEDLLTMIPDKKIEDIDFLSKIETKKFEKLQKERYRCYRYLEDAALNNLKASYILYIAKDNPYEQRDFSDFFKLIRANYLYRLIAKEYQDPSATIFVKTDTTSYQAKDLAYKSPEQLKEEIFNHKNIKTSWNWPHWNA